MPLTTDARQYFTLPSPFAMKRGGALVDAQVAYETWGTLNSNRDNAILILTGMSPSAHAASSPQDPDHGWWEAILGPDKPIDTNRFFVMCVNSLGGDKGSTGPASINPQTGEPYRLSFPALSLEDVANAAYCLVNRQFGITQLASLIGCSMGGMSALAYLLQHPGSARTHISINTAPQAQPFAIAIRSLQREAIRLDPLWNEGNYCDGCHPTRGMSVARKLGVITYRSAVEWNQRFARIRLNPDQRADQPFAFDFQVESYLDYHAKRFVGHFDPNSYLYLSRASDWFDAAEYANGDMRQALARISLDKALVIGADTDILFPLQQQEDIAIGLLQGGVDVSFVALSSEQGHDAFLVDTDNYGREIKRFLDLVNPASDRPNT